MLPSLRPLRRIVFSMILPFALLMSQQGALLHELRHFEEAVANNGEVQVKATDGDVCSACLAFAQVSGIAKPTVVALAIPVNLRFHHTVQPTITVAEAQPPAQRNRGPPSFL
jgi:hypothetical protein